MSTNYYYRDGTHLGKTTSLGISGFEFIWDEEPREVDRQSLENCDTEVVDEYGNVTTIIEFLKMTRTAKSWELSHIGRDFV